MVKNAENWWVKTVNEQLLQSIVKDQRGGKEGKEGKRMNWRKSKQIFKNLEVIDYWGLMIF